MAQRKSNKAEVYLITDDGGMFLHLVRHDSYQWREQVSPYTVCQFKHIDNALRAIKRSGMNGKPTKVAVTFTVVPLGGGQ